MSDSNLKLRPLTIFEGPDCSGKSTLVNEYRHQHVDSMVVHHGPYPGMRKRLPQLYVEAMRPLLDGYRAQIWDRCWLSEPIYGQAYRDGSRLDQYERMILERIALRHGAVVVLCLPPWEVVKEKWLERKGEEYLDKVEQLQSVYDHYSTLRNWTDLPVVLFDYTRHNREQLWKDISRVRPPVQTQLYARTAGSLGARVVLVGDKPSELTDESTWHQFPFCSFSKTGCSRWLTAQLYKAGIKELDLYWVNANDQAFLSLSTLKDRNFDYVIALGAEAAKTLGDQGIPHVQFEQPMAHKRFKGAETYPLIPYLTQILGA